MTNVGRYGHVDACRFVRGWFEDTMPTFKEPIAAAYLDVDLVSSTQTCLKYLYPLIMPGGFLTSQDGHLPLVANVLLDWQKENDVTFTGLGTQKLVWFCKPRNKAEESSKTEGIFCQPRIFVGPELGPYQPWLISQLDKGESYKDENRRFTWRGV